MIWEPLNCGSFLEKVYLRFHENMLEISLKLLMREYKHLRPEVQATLKRNAEFLLRILHLYIVCIYLLFFLARAIITPTRLMKNTPATTAGMTKFSEK